VRRCRPAEEGSPASTGTTLARRSDTEPSPSWGVPGTCRGIRWDAPVVGVEDHVEVVCVSRVAFLAKSKTALAPARRRTSPAGGRRRVGIRSQTDPVTP
jgi:hypothetical protein